MRGCTDAILWDVAHSGWPRRIWGGRASCFQLLLPSFPQCRGVGLRKQYWRHTLERGALKVPTPAMNQASPVWSHPLIQKPPVTVTDQGRRLAHFSHPHLTPPLFPLLLFTFSFSPVHDSSLCLFIYLSEANTFQRPILLHFPYLYSFSLAFEPQPTPLFLQREPWGCTVSGSLKMVHPRVRKAGSAGAEDAVQRLCAQAVRETVAWPEPSVTHLSSVLWISAIFLSSFSECLGKNWNLEL